MPSYIQSVKSLYREGFKIVFEGKFIVWTKRQLNWNKKHYLELSAEYNAFYQCKNCLFHSFNIWDLLRGSLGYGQ